MPPKPANEEARLAALDELQLLNSPTDEVVGRCVASAAESSGCSKGAVSLVDREHQWFKAVFGPLPDHTSRDVSFCAHAIANDEVLIVPDATKDPRFADNPLVRDGLRFYAGVPLHSRDGLPIGTLCVLNDSPLTLSPTQLTRLSELAHCLQSHLDLRLLTLKLGAGLKSRDEQYAQLVQLEARRRQLTAMMAHDIKSPLAAAQSTANYITSLEGVPAEVQEAVAEIALSTQAATQLICDMLDLSRSDAGQLRAQFRSVDLSEVASRLLRGLRFIAAERGQALHLVDTLSDPSLSADSTLVERTLRNLLENALKYAPSGKPVVLRLSDTPTRVELRVEDEGAVIAPEHRQKIFEPFFKLENSGRTGHGVGLAFCAKAVTLHGGTLEVEERAGGGNSFVVRLPRRPAT